ncbi:MAG: hypothetical protein IJI10_05600 [Eubacterium sp.]|nr:hypothetical protein [Eubacterium sp.]
MADNMSTHSSFEAPGTPIANDTAYEYRKIEYTGEDVRIIRDLARTYMEYASLPVQQETAKLWTDLNDLKRVRPLVWHNELPWHEINVDDELTLRTSTPFAQRIEDELRKKIYLWKHMPGDMVLEPVFYCPMLINNSGIGLELDEDISVTEAENNIVGHAFNPVIETEEDLEKIVVPEVTYDKESTARAYAAYCEIFKDILPVEIKGVQGFWFAPIDDVVMYMGTTELLINLLDDPDLVHASMRKIVDVNMKALDQYEALGALGSNSINYRVGSGAYGYSSELGRGRMSGAKCSEIWGASASQFFTSVSPEMQEEFCLPYELEWLNRFALTYYGCCERLDHKIDVLEKIPNLRKVSCSPWSNVETMAEAVGRRYVVSLKPSPACFVTSTFDEELVRKDVSSKLALLKDCNVELIIKDVSTVNHDPKRLWRWVEIVKEICLEQM